AAAAVTATLSLHAALPISPEEIEKFELRRFQPQGQIFLYRPRPSEMSSTGYLGRTTIMEFLVMNDELRSAVMRHAGMGELEQIRSEEHTSELQSRFELVCR